MYNNKTQYFLPQEPVKEGAKDAPKVSLPVKEPTKAPNAVGKDPTVRPGMVKVFIAVICYATYGKGINIHQ